MFMKQAKTLKILLIVCGGIGGLVGLEMLVAPVSMYATVGIDVAGLTNLLSDLRASGGALLLCGILIASGAFVEGLAFSSTLLSSILYLGYGLSRSVAILIDGVPADTLIVVAMIEVILGLASITALIKFRSKPVKY